MKVYLCGGIAGLSDAECKTWRERAKRMLRHETIDPMTRDYRGDTETPPSLIVGGDLYDIQIADALLVNASRPSWGTAMEIVYAFRFQKRIVAFSQCEPQMASPWLRYHCTELVRDMDEAVGILNALGI